MKSRTRVLAGAAAGMFAIGAYTGWMAPTLLGSARADTVTNAGKTAAPATPTGSIPLGTAPNYRAIVAQNRARGGRHHHRRRSEGRLGVAVRR